MHTSQMRAASTLRELRGCAPHGSLPPCGGGNAVAPLCPAADQHSRRCVHALARTRGPRLGDVRVLGPCWGGRPPNGIWVPAFAGTNGEYVAAFWLNPAGKNSIIFQ